MECGGWIIGIAPFCSPYRDSLQLIMGTIFVCSNGMLFVESSAKTAAHVADIFLAVAMKLTEPALAENLPQSVQALSSIAGDGDVQQS